MNIAVNITQVKEPSAKNLSEFSAQAYVQALRAAGHEVEFCGQHFGINAPHGFGGRYIAIANEFDPLIEADPFWKAKIQSFLQTEAI